MSNKYVSDTKTEVKQTALKDNNTSNSGEKKQEPKQSNMQKQPASNEGDTGMPGLVFLEEDPEYETAVTSEEEAAAEQIARHGWEVGGTYVTYGCNTTGYTDPACVKETWYVASPTQIDLVSYEDISYEEYLAAGGTPVAGY